MADVRYHHSINPCKHQCYIFRDKGSPEERANATAEALDLSLKYNFVTPLTSMVVTKPEDEDNPDDVMLADKLTEGKK